MSLKGDFSIETLEEVFHTLKTNIQREYNRYEKDEKIPNKPWKFYDNMLFLKAEPKPNTITLFSAGRQEQERHS